MSIFKDKDARDMASGAKLLGWFAIGLAGTSTLISTGNFFTKASKKSVKGVVAEAELLKDSIVILRDNNNDLVEDMKKVKAETEELKTKVTNTESDIVNLKTEVTPEQMTSIVNQLKSIKVKI